MYYVNSCRDSKFFVSLKKDQQAIYDAHITGHGEEHAFFDECQLRNKIKDTVAEGRISKTSKDIFDKASSL